MQHDRMVNQKFATIKTLLIRIETKNSNYRVVKKLTFWSDRLIKLKFGPSRRTYFSLQKNSSWAKIGIETDEISIKLQNLN